MKTVVFGLAFILTILTPVLSQQQGNTSANSAVQNNQAIPQGTKVTQQQLGIMFLSVVILGIVEYLKRTNYVLSSGDTRDVERKVQFATPVSKQVFRQQQSNYTQQALQALYQDPRFKKKVQTDPRLMQRVQQEQRRNPSLAYN